ncbi:MAG: helix-turn-helix domain-containing protein, partial [Planctomycetaceae bacterium]|nr:helix-turn-helix domain-containing protein [Planctomycetaceae bacterium]
PAADPRTGRGEFAPWGTPYHIGVPFAALPHDIAADPRLRPTDLRLLAALLYYARQQPCCYPSDAALAARVHRHPGTVRRCLKRLEDLGYIRREFLPATPANPTGRLISLTFREPDWPRPTPDLSERRCAPAPERRRTPTPRADERTPRAPAPVSPRAPAHAEEDVIVKKDEILEEAARSDLDRRSRPVEPTAPPTTNSEVPPAPAPTTATTPALAFDLTAIGAAPELPAARLAEPRHRRLGLDLAELARVVGETADPILIAELARRTAPPGPPEPPPVTLPTLALFERLPGRHDLILAAARRLCEETGDFKVASQRTFEQMASAVATRAVPAAVLLSCWRQAMGPKAEHRGKVLVAAWGREAQPCQYSDAPGPLPRSIGR